MRKKLSQRAFTTLPLKFAISFFEVTAALALGSFAPSFVECVLLKEDITDTSPIEITFVTKENLFAYLYLTLSRFFI